MTEIEMLKADILIHQKIIRDLVLEKSKLIIEIDRLREKLREKHATRVHPLFSKITANFMGVN